MVIAHVNDRVLNTAVGVSQLIVQIKRRIRVDRDAGIPENLLELIAERTGKKDDESIKSGLGNVKSKPVSAPVNRSQPVECPIWIKQDAGWRMLAGDWLLKTAWIHWWSGSTA